MPATIDEQIANLREVRVLVAQSLTELDEHLDALAKAKKLLKLNIQVALPQYDGQEHPSRFVPPQAKIMTISQPDVDTSCITHCTSIPESMFAWADANNGELDGKSAGNGNPHSRHQQSQKRPQRRRHHPQLRRQSLCKALGKDRSQQVPSHLRAERRGRRTAIRHPRRGRGTRPRPDFGCGLTTAGTKCRIYPKTTEI